MDPFLVKVWPGIVLGYVFALIWFLVMLFFAIREKSSLTIALVFLGSIVGWTIGLLLTSVNPQEDIAFKNALGAIGTLVTGYVLAKFGDICAQLKADGARISMAIVIFSCTFVVGFLCVVIWRFEAAPTPRAASAQATAMPSTAPRTSTRAHGSASESGGPRFVRQRANRPNWP
jgi:hypothetical protein